MTQYALLPDRAVLAVTGEDARTYLQGIVTNDVRNVAPDRAVFTALLSPQGKYLFEFFMLEHDGAIWLETDKARLPELVKRLTLYRLRAKVVFEPQPEQVVAACWGGDVALAGASVHAYADPRHEGLGSRFIGHGAALHSAFSSVAPADYEAHRLSLAIPEGGKDLVIDRSILLEYGYDHLHAIDFTKGCYIGQEVTARSKHRATLHKYVHSIVAEAPLPPPGTPVMADGREVGELRSHHGTAGLALLRTADAALSPNLTAGEVRLRAQLPAWIAK